MVKKTKKIVFYFRSIQEPCTSRQLNESLGIRLNSTKIIKSMNIDPTNPATEEEKDKFYETLENTIGNVNKAHIS